MYDHYYELLLTDSRTFNTTIRPRPFKVLDVNKENPAEPTLSNVDINMDDAKTLETWLSEEQSETKPLKLLSLAPVYEGDVLVSDRLLCSDTTWLMIEKSWKYRPTVFKSFLGGGAMPYFWDDGERLGIVLVTKTIGPWFVSAAVYHKTTKSTQVFLNSDREEPEQSLVVTLGYSLADTWLPSMIPIMLIESIIITSKDLSDYTFHSLNKIRTDLGLSPYRAAEEPDDMDLLEVTRELTRLSQTTAAEGHSFNILDDNIKAVDQLHRAFLAQCDQSVKDEHAAVLQDVEERLAYAFDHTKLRKEWNAMRVKEIQACIQTVYTMLASRDNALNYKAAEVSVRTAQLARKDSADMRVIAAVTLFFLPATFVSTLFSTSFFNFQPDNDGDHVSSWYWLYWVITLGLTLIVLIGWLFSQKALDKIKSIPVIEEIRAKYHEKEQLETTGEVHAEQKQAEQTAEEVSP